MATTIERIIKIGRAGEYAEVQFDTGEAATITVQIPMSRLWEIAADLRQASIHLLAPVPLYNPSAWQSAVARKDDIAPEDQPMPDEPAPIKTGFDAVEEAWELCDKLNQPENKRLDKLSALETLSPIDKGLFSNLNNVREFLEKNGYVDLKTGLIIRYREETRDWVPDRHPADEEV